MQEARTNEELHANLVQAIEEVVERVQMYVEMDEQSAATDGMCMSLLNADALGAGKRKLFELKNELKRISYGTPVALLLGMGGIVRPAWHDLLTAFFSGL